MLYLIGGPPRCGKTTLAKMIAQKKGISHIPGDYLKCIIKQYTKPQEAAVVTPIFSKKLTTDQLYQEHTPEQIKNEYIASAKHTQKGFWAFVEYALHDNRDFVIEGYPLLPTFMAEYRDNPQVKALCVYYNGPLH